MIVLSLIVCGIAIVVTLLQKRRLGSIPLGKMADEVKLEVSMIRILYGITRPVQPVVDVIGILAALVPLDATFQWVVLLMAAGLTLVGDFIVESVRHYQDHNAAEVAAGRAAPHAGLPVAHVSVVRSGLFTPWLALVLGVLAFAALAGVFTPIGLVGITLRLLVALFFVYELVGDLLTYHMVR